MYVRVFVVKTWGYNVAVLNNVYMRVYIYPRETKAPSNGVCNWEKLSHWEWVIEKAGDSLEKGSYFRKQGIYRYLYHMTGS